MFSILSRKQCTKCKEWKDKSEFHKNRRRKSGLADKCKKCALEKQLAYAAQHREQERLRAAKWRKENPEKNSEMKRRYHQANREADNQHLKNWQKANPERVKELNRQWYKDHPDWVQERRHKRRSQKTGNGGRFTAAEWRALKQKYDYTCLRCRKQEPEIKLTPDHVKPLVQGGSNSIDNIQPLCFSCNCSKRDKHIDYR